MKRRLFLVLILLLIGTAYFWQLPEREKSLSIDYQKLVSRTTPEGYVQTPRGGGIGSSDVKRPTFSELHIRPVRISEQITDWSWPYIQVYAGRRLIHLSGNVHLAQPLLTYGLPFKKGEFFKSAISFDTYRTGIELPIRWKDWTVAPIFELALLDFAYAFSTQMLHDLQHAFYQDVVSRLYQHLTLRLGFKLRYHLSDNLTLTCLTLESIPLIDGFNMLDQSAILEIKAAEGEELVGLQKIRIHYEDGQAMPNHIYLNTGFAKVTGRE